MVQHNESIYISTHILCFWKPSYHYWTGPKIIMFTYSLFIVRLPLLLQYTAIESVLIACTNLFKNQIVFIYFSVTGSVSKKLGNVFALKTKCAGTRLAGHLPASSSSSSNLTTTSQ